MIVLDTNVLSETLRPDPDAGVLAWIEAQPRTTMFTTTVTRGELLYCVRLLNAGRRRTSLLRAVQAIFDEDLAGQVLSFDNASSDVYAEIAARRKLSGKPMSQFDAMIAAIAHSRGASLATRNIKDFTDCGIELIDPWHVGV